MNARTDMTMTAPALAAAHTRTTRVAIGVAGALLFAGLTTVGAYIVIPIEPVPITMQT